MMIHEGYCFDFPGRSYAFRHADLDGWFVAATGALRAIAGVVEPTVVEAIDETHAIFHLVTGDAAGGAYIRNPTRTVSVERIDGAGLVAWLGEVTREGTSSPERLSIADGWFPVDAHVGDVLRLREGWGAQRVSVVEWRGKPALLAPNTHVIVAPLTFDLLADTGELRIAVLWSPWTDADGVGRARFDRMIEELASAGWRLAERPDPASLDWRKWTSAAAAAVAADPVREQLREREAPAELVAREPSWVTLSDSIVELGVSAGERDQLVDALVSIDRVTFEAEASLGFRWYDERGRRDEIRTALNTALGRAEVRVARCEVMQRPASNQMWSDYMAATGAARPAAWPASSAPVADDPVTGISPDEAAAFAAHHGWALPTEAEWQLAASTSEVDLVLDGACEYTSDSFEPYPGADTDAFDAMAPGARGQVCGRGKAPRLPPCVAARRGVSRDARPNFVRFRCIRRM